MKKACPIALITTLELILEKSGLNKKLTAADKSPDIEEYIHKATTKKNNVGIKRFIVLPIPSITPFPTIEQVMTINNECQKSIFWGELTNSAK